MAHDDHRPWWSRHQRPIVIVAAILLLVLGIVAVAGVLIVSSALHDSA